MLTFSLNPEFFLPARLACFGLTAFSLTIDQNKKQVSLISGTCHLFRSLFATHLLPAERDIRTLQKLLGHTDVKITQIYMHVLGQHLSMSIKNADHVRRWHL